MTRLRVVSLAIVLAFACVGVTASAVPQLLNYQGILRTSAHALVTDSTYSVVFRLYDAENEGDLLWQETQSVSTNDGHFNVLMGAVNAVPESAFVGDAYLSTQISPDGELSPRSRITSVGYAFQAGNADKLDGYDAVDLLTSGNAPQVFRAYALFPTGSSMVLSSGAGSIRHITGIHIFGGGDYYTQLSVGGNPVIRVRQGLPWTSGNGAPIEVGVNEIIEAQHQTPNLGDVSILITGWEY